MREDRLLEVATLLYFVALHEDANKHFSMRFFRFSIDRPICQTAACAMGYAMEMYPNEFKIYRLGHMDTTVGYLPIYQGGIGMAAVELFFDLSETDVNEIFGASHDRSAKGEADVICAYVEAHHKIGINLAEDDERDRGRKST